MADFTAHGRECERLSKTCEVGTTTGPARRDSTLGMLSFIQVLEIIARTAQALHKEPTDLEQGIAAAALTQSSDLWMVLIPSAHISSPSSLRSAIVSAVSPRSASPSSRMNLGMAGDLSHLTKRLSKSSRRFNIHWARVV